jgi:hypothetical protein
MKFMLEQKPDTLGDTFDACWDKGTSIIAYVSGKRKPNYPMPAIPLAVLLAKDYVAIATLDWFEGELMEFIVLAEYEKE